MYTYEHKAGLLSCSHQNSKIVGKPKSWLQGWSERLIKTPSSSPAVLSGGKREEKVGVINNVFTAH